MSRMRRILGVAPGRILSGVQIFFLLAATSCVHPAALEPRAGLFQYQEPLLFAVPGGRVNLAGGNLIVRRVDLSIDTHLGKREVAGVYNSATGAWTRSFELEYDGRLFTDSSGGVHDVAELADGEAIPGTVWVRIDARRIGTKGGLIHTFSEEDHMLEQLSWSGQAYPRLAYLRTTVAGAERITRVDQCIAQDDCQPVYSIGYDEFGCVDRIVDRASRVALFESGEQCAVRVARDALDVERGWPGYRYEYSGALLTAVTSSEEERIEYAWVRGRARKVTAVSSDAGMPDRVYVFSHVYNGNRRLYASWVDDPRGGQTLVRYDGEGRVLERVNAAGDVTYWLWSGMRPRQKVEPGGLITRWEYQGDDATRMVLASGNVVDVEYAPGAVDRERPDQRPWLRISDLLGLVEEREYDASGRLIARTNGAGERTAYEWSAEGTLARLTEPTGLATRYFDYGEHGHAETVRRGSLTTAHLYDDVGNPLSGGRFDEQLRPSGPGVGRLAYDGDRNVVSAELVAEEPGNNFAPELMMLGISYRSDGQRTRIDRPYGGAVELVYDGFGQLAEQRERVDGAWVVTRMERDAAGDRVATELANGMRREVEYDPAGRPTNVRLLTDGVLEKELEASWMNGRLESRRDSSYALPEVFEYDAAGRMLRTHFPDGEMLELTHDLRSRETARRFWTGQGGLLIRSLAFGYDGADRRTRILDEGEMVLEKEVEDGRLALIRYGNGLTRSFEYDEDLGMQIYSETRDALGWRVARSEYEWSQCRAELVCLVATAYVDDIGGVLTGSYGYTQEAYALGPQPSAPTGGEHGMRVLSWEPGGGTSTVSDLYRRLGYDALGNWVGVAPGAGGPATVSFEFNAERNRLLSSDHHGHHDYVWDAAGFLIQRDATPLTWSAAGKLTSIGDDITLEWDVLGRPIRAIVDGAESRSLFGGEMQGNAQRQPVSLDLGEVRIDLANGQRHYRHYDIRNNVRFVTDDRGYPSVFYSYTPYGIDRAWGDDQDGVSFAQGRKLGDFIILGARIYDPETGRFISPDPIYGELSQHTYTAGNTVLLWDPGGMMSVRTALEVQKVLEMIVNLILLLIGLAFTLGRADIGAGLIFLLMIILILYFLVGMSASGSPSGPGPYIELPDGMGSQTIGPKLSPPNISSTCAPATLSMPHVAGSFGLWLLAVNLLVALCFAARHRRNRE
jgi:RHS repeat-associated protein